jgi:acetyl esterase/lipase
MAAIVAEGPLMPQEQIEWNEIHWPALTAEPGGVDYVEVNACGIPGCGFCRKVPTTEWFWETAIAAIRASPLYADLAGLPPMFLQAGADETIVDDSRMFVDLAKTAGVEVRFDVFPEMLHTFQMMAGRAGGRWRDPPACQVGSPKAWTRRLAWGEVNSSES